jgi:hypothetical protein
MKALYWTIVGLLTGAFFVFYWWLFTDDIEMTSEGDVYLMHNSLKFVIAFSTLMLGSMLLLVLTFWFDEKEWVTDLSDIPAKVYFVLCCVGALADAISIIILLV